MWVLLDAGNEVDYDVRIPWGAILNYAYKNLKFIEIYESHEYISVFEVCNQLTPPALDDLVHLEMILMRLLVDYFIYNHVYFVDELQRSSSIVGC